MPLMPDAIGALNDELVRECRYVLKLRSEKKQYAEAYNRFVAIQKELQEHERKIEELAGIMGDKWNESDSQDDADTIVNIFDPARIGVDPWQFRNELPLWKAIRWYVGYAGEARINDVLTFLVKTCGIKGANRNAVESALRLHPETFNIRRNKREKFISLKGA
jgi:hypothetical protein